VLRIYGDTIGFPDIGVGVSVSALQVVTPGRPENNLMFDE
jgi:hypothetical protein